MKNLNLKKLIKESISDFLTELNLEQEEVKEAPTLEEGASEFEDKVTKDGNIYLVLKADKNMAEGGIVREVSLKSLIDSYSSDVAGAYLAGPQALTAGKKLLKARDAKLKENIVVGKSKVTELEAKIEDLKKQIENNSTMSLHDPQRRNQLQETNDGLLAQLEKIEQGVEKLKKALEKSSPKKEKKSEKEEPEEKKNELDEVTSNTSKAFSWFWGTDAKDIAKRIQKMSDKDLKTLASTNWKDSGGPAKIQKSFLDREIKKRNL